MRETRNTTRPGAAGAGDGRLPTRRQALLLGGAGLVALATPGRGHGAPPADQALTLTAGTVMRTLPAMPGRPLPLMLYDGTPFRTIRLRKGERLRATLENRLPEHTSIHWHGLRITNGMDGVPWLTQPPTEPGERFTYDFAPPDSGTFFFHPHCNVIGQVGRGLAGIMVVENPDDPPFAAEHVLAVRDWRIDIEKGGFLPMTTDAGAGKAGTFGTVRSVNGEAQPDFSVPAGGYARVRLLALDATRVMEIGIEGAEAAIVAVDGFAVGPLPLSTWRMGTAMRLDLAIRIDRPGGVARLLDYFAPSPVTLATFTAHGEAPTRQSAFDPPALAPHGLPEPDLANALTLPFVFGASGQPTPVAEPIVLPDGVVFDPSDNLCTSERTFWSINQQSWPGHGAAGLPQPLATLERGRSYVYELVNTTPHTHPIHTHGFGCKVLSCSRLSRPVHRSDTILLLPKERIRVAFVADNPGNWMFHCHILEHEETGMMGIIRVL